MVVGGRWEEQEEDESVPCSMEMELYCCCLIATQHRSCLQEGNSKNSASDKGTDACRCSKYTERSAGDDKTDLL